MKALKPYQDEIKEKFKDNKDMQNRALSKLFEDSNTNPLAGCLVSLLQLPIFLALYRSVTFLAREGNLDEPFLWIPSLEGPVSAANDYRGMEWLTQGWVHSSDSLFGWEPALGYAGESGEREGLLIMGTCTSFTNPLKLFLLAFFAALGFVENK